MVAVVSAVDFAASFRQVHRPTAAATRLLPQASTVRMVAKWTLIVTGVPIIGYALGSLCVIATLKCACISHCSCS